MFRNVFVPNVLYKILLSAYKIMELWVMIYILLENVIFKRMFVKSVIVMPFLCLTRNVLFEILLKCEPSKHLYDISCVFCVHVC